MKIPVTCETDGCALMGCKINEITIAPDPDNATLDLFFEAYGQGSEDPEDFCPLCKELGILGDPEL